MRWWFSLLFSHRCFCLRVANSLWILSNSDTCVDRFKHKFVGQRSGTRLTLIDSGDIKSNCLEKISNNILNFAQFSILSSSLLIKSKLLKSLNKDGIFLFFSSKVKQKKKFSIWYTVQANPERVSGFALFWKVQPLHLR